ncbi:hypothetical protein MIMGU_mgv1a010940mg [Erythranthe guttata]|uniref:Uncharacterized protein n=1 Tax=Erythranthe guttata TaxID=4155 RepID=A0A022QJH7_ERYGU|nr:hypothetical protein MIMGU_mgv1a010940mg [Erythranthe guttata]
MLFRTRQAVADKTQILIKIEPHSKAPILLIQSLPPHPIPPPTISSTLRPSPNSESKTTFPNLTQAPSTKMKNSMSRTKPFTGWKNPYTAPRNPPHNSLTSLMERPGDFDPNRIPSSIFSRPSTPTEWSVASNDSLFSIHIGNNSFSRDHVSRIGVDLYRSGELQKSGELSKSEELCQTEESYKPWELFQSQELFQSTEVLTNCDTKRSSELVKVKQTSPTRKGVVKPNKNLDVVKSIDVDVGPGETARIDEPTYDVPKATVGNSQVEAHTEYSGDSRSANFRSDKSETSIPSFALPM